MRSEISGATEPERRDRLQPVAAMATEVRTSEPEDAGDAAFEEDEELSPGAAGGEGGWDGPEPVFPVEERRVRTSRCSAES